MRRYKKKGLLEAIDTLFKANDFMVKNCKSQEEENILKVLIQCQELALELGNYLETLGETGTALVHILEDYCEDLYQITCHLSDKNTYRKISKRIKKQLSNLKSDILEVIPDDKIEMVFFPYKASMWDSLESVWRAADEDPDCDAYVVPIPYFEKNSAGELATEYYEGEQFPEDVPVVHYMDYNMEEHRPDVAFIHNPYDQYNYVTSVHPAYYIAELKKYAGKVAYIPYYVSAETNPEAPEVQKQKEGFILTSGVLYSDFVFVQSESMKQLYVNVLKKNVSGMERKYWENKIFGLGSPKMDRVHSVKRDDSRLPLKWRTLIFDETGKRKKVILYNISVADLLNHENMMEKIADTLSFFEKNRDCVLWWRPHPLYDSTIRSMRPDLLETYHQMVEQYKAGGWGIFDEGEDLNWAISETDAYYGDGSSVVQLYLESGKPVLYQDTRVKNTVEMDANIPVWPCAFCVDGDDIWFVHGKINILMRYSISKGYTYIVDIVPNEIPFQEGLYSSIYKWKQKVFLIPCWAKKIKVYDIIDKQFIDIQLKDAEEYNTKLLFCKSYVCEKNLYCIPYYYGSIIKIDMDSCNLEYFDITILINKRKIDPYKTAFINDATKINDEVYSIVSNTNKVLIFDLKTNRIQLQDISSVKKDFVSISNVGNDMFLFDETTCELVKICKNNAQKADCFPLPFRGVKINTINSKYILVDAADSNEIRIIDSEGKIVYKSEAIMGDYENSICPSLRCGIMYEQDENVCYFYNVSDFLIYKFENGEIYKAYKFVLFGKELKKLRGMNWNVEQYAISENEMFNLDTWLNRIRTISGCCKNKYRNNGEKILETVKVLCH